MNCVLHNEACIKNDNDLSLAKKFISRQMDNIQVLACRPPFPCAMDLFFSCSKEDKYVVSCLLNIDGQENHIQENGGDIMAVLKALFARVKQYLQEDVSSVPQRMLHSEEISNQAS